jgi:hypothetical protein
MHVCTCESGVIDAACDISVNLTAEKGQCTVINLAAAIIKPNDIALGVLALLLVANTEHQRVCVRAARGTAHKSATLSTGAAAAVASQHRARRQPFDMQMSAAVICRQMAMHQTRAPKSFPQHPHANLSALYPVNIDIFALFTVLGFDFALPFHSHGYQKGWDWNYVRLLIASDLSICQNIAPNCKRKKPSIVKKNSEHF